MADDDEEINIDSLPHALLERVLELSGIASLCVCAPRVNKSWLAASSRALAGMQAADLTRIPKKSVPLDGNPKDPRTGRPDIYGLWGDAGFHGAPDCRDLFIKNLDFVQSKLTSVKNLTLDFDCGEVYPGEFLPDFVHLPPGFLKCGAELTALTIISQPTDEEVLDVAKACPLLEHLHWQVPVLWSTEGWTFSPPALVKLKSLCVHLKSTPLLQPRGVNEVALLSQESLSEIAALFDILRSWPTIEEVKLQALLPQLDPRSDYRSDPLVQLASDLADEPGDFKGKVHISCFMVIEEHKIYDHQIEVKEGLWKRVGREGPPPHTDALREETWSGMTRVIVDHPRVYLWASSVLPM